VKLDADFAKVIKRGDYRVFLTPEGDCRGLYVRRKIASFEVRELMGGKSNIAFSYRIVGRRKDVRDRKRFPSSTSHRRCLGDDAQHAHDRRSVRCLPTRASKLERGQDAPAGARRRARHCLCPRCSPRRASKPEQRRLAGASARRSARRARDVAYWR
jgi:hypothetical protein